MLIESCIGLERIRKTVVDLASALGFSRVAHDAEKGFPGSSRNPGTTMGY